MRWKGRNLLEEISKQEEELEMKTWEVWTFKKRVFKAAKAFQFKIEQGSLSRQMMPERDNMER